MPGFLSSFSPPEKNGNERPRALGAFLALAGVEGVLALVALLALPGEAHNRLPLGFSNARLALAAAILLLVLALAALLWNLRRNETWGANLCAWLAALLKPAWVYTALLVLCLAVVFLGVQLGNAALKMPDASVRAYLVRLLPLVAWLTLMCAQALIVLPVLRNGGLCFAWDAIRSEVRLALLIFAALLALWGFVITSGLGLQPDVVGWHDPGAPLLPLQALLVWVAGVALLVFSLLFSPRRLWTFDLLAALLVWLVAVWLWQAQPLSPNYFALRPVPPNFEYYPYSDATGYDLTAQRLLLGWGFGWMPLKPLYALFLAVLHAFAGQDYASVVNSQVLVFGLFPVVLYFLGVLLHQRLTGLFVAGMVILREANAIQLSGVIRVAHAKLMLSDLPTAAMMALFVLVVVFWLRRGGESKGLPLLAGGILGALTLLRPQTMILAPCVGAFLLVYFARRWRYALLAVVLLGIGTLLGVSGWMWRAWQTTGSLTLNDPGQTMYMTAVYHPAPNAENLYVNALPSLPGETTAEYNARIQKAVLDFIRTQPGVVARFVGAHFLHNQVESLLVLPLSAWVMYDFNTDLFPYWREQRARLWDVCCSARAYVETLPYWGGWKGALAGDSILPLALSLLMLALGLAAGWQKAGAVVLFPGWMNVAYTLSTAIGRQSGWRFTLPVDWVFILFFAAGLAQVTLWLGRLVFPLAAQAPARATADAPASGLPRWKYAWLLGFLAALCIGWTLPLAESAFPQRYGKVSEERAWQIAQERADALQQAGLSLQTMREAGLQAYGGVVFYPRYYRAGQGESPTGAPAFVPRPFNRIGFTLMGEQTWQVVLPCAAPSRLPNAAAAVVFACPAGNFVDAWAVILEDQDVVLTRAPLAEKTCPAQKAGSDR